MTTHRPAPVPTGPRAAGVHWDLSPLVADADEARAPARGGPGARPRVRVPLPRRPRGHGRPRPGRGPGRARRDRQRLSRVSSYATPARVGGRDRRGEQGPRRPRSTGGLVEAGNALRFFDLEWIALHEERAPRPVRRARGGARPPLPGGDAPLRAAHALEPEERMLAERGPAAVSAWHTLFGQITSTLEVPFDAGEGGEPHTIDRLLAHVRDPDRDLRRRALEALYDAARPARRAGPLLRHAGGRPPGDGPRCAATRRPMDPTHLRNELPGGGGRGAMLDAVERHYPLAHRWFRVKAGILASTGWSCTTSTRRSATARSVDYPEARAAHRRRRSAASRRAWPSSPAGSSRSAASTPSRGRASAAAPSAPRSPRTPRPTCS